MTILLIEPSDFTFLRPTDPERLMMAEASKNLIKEDMPAAFVLQMGTNGLGVTRSLGREGVRVVGVDFDPRALGFSSRYCQPVLCPEPIRDPGGVVEVLIEEADRFKEKPVLYPSTDAFVLLLSRNRKVLEDHFRFAISPDDIIEGLMDKRRLYDWAEKVGTPYPQILCPNNLSDLEGMKDRILYPAFIKPCYSHLWAKRYNNKGFVVNNYREVVERFNSIFPSGLDAMIQTIVQGPESNIVTVSTYIGRKGEPLGAFVHQKIRQCPKDFGVGSLTKSIHDDNLSSEALRFFRGIGYRGIGSLEFKRDERDGKFRLIELNARPWLPNVQATYSGINFPLIQYLDLLERRVEPIRDYKDGVRWFDSIGDLESYWAYRKSGSLSFGDWVRSWLGSECHARFAWDDIRPSLVAAEYGLAYIKLLKRLSQTEKKDRPQA
jgi:predicted ATP-grasp superfamily ATP-dependent carboligase